jgi:hypothetical protein
LPVEVPAGCEGLSVRLDMPDDDGVVVDLGCEGAGGWRGWSGGARREFAITPVSATPGYLPGELEPGEWSVVIGLHRIPVDGVEIRVEAVTGPVSEVPGLAAYDNATAAVPVPVQMPETRQDRPPRREMPAPAGMRWVACDFHTHTLHSDGAMPVADVAALGVRAGLDLLAITDHNTVAHHAELSAIGKRLGIGLLAGQEVTTESGHANAFGEIGWIDFRQPASYWVEEVGRRGGVISINHPLTADCCWRQPLPERPPLAELWHTTWLDRRWGGPVAWWQAWGLDTAPIGGSDWHGPDSLTAPGSPTTWVCVDAAATGPDELAVAVLESLRERRTAVAADRQAPVLLRVDEDLVAIDAAGTLILQPDGKRVPVRSDYEIVPAAYPEGHVLMTHAGEVLSLAAGSGRS